MPKPSSNRRLFEADGYTFKCWISLEDVEALLACRTICVCRAKPTGREIGYRLVGAGRCNLVPFGRVLNPMLKPPSIHYPIPAMGDHRLRWMNRFLDRSVRPADPDGSSHAAAVLPTQTIASGPSAGVCA